MAQDPRFTVSHNNYGSFIIDEWHGCQTYAFAFTEASAEFITALLNCPCIAAGGAKTNPRLRPLAAMEISDFRMFLEHENGVPLNEEPDIAMLLDNLCAFLHFNTGERALALGPDLLVLLNRFEDEPSSAIQIINSDATIPVEDLAVIR
ncbi:MAG: hypothetical protein ACOYBO_00945 [Azonexus sp.]